MILEEVRTQVLGGGCCKSTVDKRTCKGAVMESHVPSPVVPFHALFADHTSNMFMGRSSPHRMPQEGSFVSTDEEQCRRGAILFPLFIKGNTWVHVMVVVVVESVGLLFLAVVVIS